MDCHFLLQGIVKGQVKTVANQGSITLPTKVYLVKAMVFPVVMYGCESWTIKKAETIKLDYKEELMLLNCGVEEDS